MQMIHDRTNTNTATNYSKEEAQREPPLGQESWEQSSLGQKEQISEKWEELQPPTMILWDDVCPSHNFTGRSQSQFSQSWVI